MKATFLGHQGWLLESDKSRLLIDPILMPYFRNSPHTKMWIFPPRSIDVPAMGHVDAIYLSHEHEDHFHIESMNQLSRRTKVYVTMNITTAAERILTEMGFDVTRVPAMSPIEIGSDLKMTLFPPPSSPTEHWVLQPFVECKDGTNYFNPVDCSLSTEFVEYVRNSKISLGLVTMANNSQITPETRHPTDFKPGVPLTTSVIEPLRPLLGTMEALRDLPPMQGVAVIGGGFLDETNPYGLLLNQDMVEFAKTIFNYSRRSIPIFAPVPGDVVVLEQSRLDFGRASWVVSCAEADAIVYDAKQNRFSLDALGYEYEPSTQRRSIDDVEWNELTRLLGELSRRLTVHPITMEMIQQNLLDNGVPSGMGRMLLILLDDDGRRLLEFVPADGGFRAVAADEPIFALAHKYPFGYEVWASDFLELLRGHIPVYEIILFKNRAWKPKREYHFKGNFAMALNDIMAAEAWPELTYRLYQSAWQRCSQLDTQETIRNPVASMSNQRS